MPPVRYNISLISVRLSPMRNSSFRFPEPSIELNIGKEEESLSRFIVSKCCTQRKPTNTPKEKTYYVRSILVGIMMLKFEQVFLAQLKSMFRILSFMSS